MSNDSRNGGNNVTLETFKQWNKEGVKEIFGFKTIPADNYVYSTEVWWNVCAAHHFANYPNLKGQVLDPFVERFIDGINNVKKSASYAYIWMHQQHIKLRWNANPNLCTK